MPTVTHKSAAIVLTGVLVCLPYDSGSLQNISSSRCVQCQHSSMDRMKESWYDRITPRSRISQTIVKRQILSLPVSRLPGPRITPCSSWAQSRFYARVTMHIKSFARMCEPRWFGEFCTDVRISKDAQTLTPCTMV